MVSGRRWLDSHFFDSLDQYSVVHCSLEENGFGAGFSPKGHCS